MAGETPPLVASLVHRDSCSSRSLRLPPSASVGGSLSPPDPHDATALQRVPRYCMPSRVGRFTCLWSLDAGTRVTPSCLPRLCLQPPAVLPSASASQRQQQQPSCSGCMAACSFMCPAAERRGTSKRTDGSALFNCCKVRRSSGEEERKRGKQVGGVRQASEGGGGRPSEKQRHSWGAICLA